MVGFGSTFALSIATPVALKLDPRHMPYVHQLSMSLNRFFATPALIVVIATGFYQVSEGNWSFGDAWISATFAIAIALGARAVLVGRPVIWGLAARGEDGVRHVFELLRDELAVALALLGCPSPDRLGREHLAAAI